jgi:hypothetical protein
VACQGLLGRLKLLFGLLQAPANGKRIALDKLMDNVQQFPLGFQAL